MASPKRKEGEEDRDKLLSGTLGKKKRREGERHSGCGEKTEGKKEEKVKKNHFLPKRKG